MNQRQKKAKEKAAREANKAIRDKSKGKLTSAERKAAKESYVYENARFQGPTRAELRGGSSGGGGNG